MNLPNPNEAIPTGSFEGNGAAIEEQIVQDIGLREEIFLLQEAAIRETFLK